MTRPAPTRRGERRHPHHPATDKDESLDGEPPARGMTRRGFHAGLFDEPDWPARVAGLGRRARSEALLAGCERVEEELRAGDPAAARSLALAIAAALDLAVAEQPGPTPYFVTDLSPFGRGPKRMGCADLRELVERLRSLAEREAWLLPEHLPRRGPGPPG